MFTYNCISKSEEDTKNIAKELASQINTNNVLVLTGELGSGKTKFVEGFLSYYNLENEISSPTFTIVNEYRNDKTTIFHFDVYRLKNVDEFYAIGGDEYFEKGICIIEWGELVEDALPKNCIKITLKKSSENENSRIITITSNSVLEKSNYFFLL